MNTTHAPAKQRHNYFSRMLIGGAAEQTCLDAASTLNRVKFDTLVVIGLSGALAGGLIANALGVNLYVLRKPQDTTHDGLGGFGLMGERWVFLDDFISSGRTYKGVLGHVDRLYNDGVWDTWDDGERTPAKPLTHVGVYLYNYGDFRTPNQAREDCYDWHNI